MNRGAEDLTQTLDPPHSVDRGSPGLVGDQGQLAEILPPVTACDLHLRVVLLVCLSLDATVISGKIHS